ncbi:MAG: glycoside hydrolase family 3 C-terminal domain-containing protein, partial [Bacteroidales bacterium]|nr:glycoside hydrolase family 3 C-terminal domain-containing protein [Bacteroidales bacterium]
FTAVSDEARVKHRIALQTKGKSEWYDGLTFWTPNINIFRDPRWGRGMETYGEDPYLTGRMGLAVVRGLQGDSFKGGSLDEDSMLKTHACAKHFAVHSGPESSRHRYNAEVSERDLRETYLPAFRDLVCDGFVREVMFAYNSFRGKPCGANEYLLQSILRGEWGYTGVILSDCGAVDDFHAPWGHHFTVDKAESSSATVKAGCDLECGGVLRWLVEAVERGLIDEELINERVTRLLTARIMLGELDGVPTPWDSIPESVLCSDEHRALALEIARESMVLLKNDSILPLSADMKIGLVGPNAADSTMMLGNYEGTPRHIVTLYEALSGRVPSLVYNKGCEILWDEMTPEKAAAVVETVADCDVVIYAGGISPRLEGEEMPVEHPDYYCGDRLSIELPACQRELVAALTAAGKKVVFVNFSGSSLALVPEVESCEALLQAWYPGQEGGTAIADVLFGDYNPCGKLPLTFYKSVDQLPSFEDYSMKGRTYRFFEGEPMYPFGYGLSYTSFEYSSPKVRGGLFGPKKLVVKVTNTGSVEGTETVQLYVRRPGDEEGPLKTLRGFRKVSLRPGATRRVVFKLTPDVFEWWNAEKSAMEPLAGDYEALVGSSSADLQAVSVKY